MKRGILITLEGNEGCGKSTQIRLLSAALRKMGKKVFLTREPGGTSVGDQIRKVLLSEKNRSLSPLSETMLYMASRAQLVSEVIKPHLAKGHIVLCDRWMDATLAYQGYAGGVNIGFIRALGAVATQGVTPKVSLYLDLPVKVGLRRAVKRRKADRIEKKALSFHENVRRGFLAIARREPSRFRKLTLREKDSIAEVHACILKEVRRVL